MRFDDVVLLTHTYPYWLGPTAETYLEEEVRVLATRARRIFCVAIENWDPEKAPIRKGVPSNVIPLVVPMKSYELDERPLSRRLAQLRATFSSEFVSELPKLSSRERLREYYRFVRRSDLIASEVLKRLRDVAPDVGRRSTLVYSFWFNEPARVAVLLSRELSRNGGPMVAISRAHGYDCYDYRSDIGYLPAKTWMATHLDRVLVCSENGRRHLAEGNPRAAGRFEVGYLGTKWVEPSHERISPSENLVVTCSRVVPLKRLDRIACALALLEREGRPFKWVCIGDGPELPALRALVAQLGLEDRVEFTGALAQDELYRFYESNDVCVFVNASESEGVPISIMEALSFGIPVVATDVGGNPEIVLDGKCGTLVPGDFSNQDLASAIGRYLCMDSISYRLAARRNWERRFSVSTNTARLLSELEGMADERSQSGGARNR